jgi:hypothetical protein
MTSFTPLELGLGLVILLLVGAMLVMLLRNGRRSELRSKFGAEYDRTVRATGSTRRAEAALEERARRVATFALRPLTPLLREELILTWRQVQTKFVDDPSGAVDHADVLLGEVMVARGYPVADFDHRAEDLSVDHPEVVQNYRAGHNIATRHARGEATTEDLRQAMIHYRALFDELVNEPGATDPAPLLHR